MNKTAIIIPVFNEADNLPILFENIEKIERPEFTFIFVNDGSQDNSLEILKTANLNHLLINHKKNLGLASAVKSGIDEAKKLDVDYVVKVDADLQHNLEEIDLLLKEINEEVDLSDESIFVAAIDTNLISIDCKEIFFIFGECVCEF